jgi:hypothetical protein
MQTRKKQKPFVTPWIVLLVLLILLSPGCTTQPKPLQPAPVRSVQLPPLSQDSQIPETPSECLPTCLQGLINVRESWLKLLTPASSHSSPASTSTTPVGTP